MGAIEDAFENGQPVSDRAICQSVTMSRQTLYEWRLQPAFREWMAERINARNDDWELVLQKYTQ